MKHILVLTRALVQRAAFLHSEINTIKGRMAKL